MTPDKKLPIEGDVDPRAAQKPPLQAHDLYEAVRHLTTAQTAQLAQTHHLLVMIYEMMSSTKVRELIDDKADEEMRKSYELASKEFMDTAKALEHVTDHLRIYIGRPPFREKTAEAAE